MSFCGACHEQPVAGGSAPRYRDFYIQAEELADGTQLGFDLGGIVHSYGIDSADTRPGVDENANIFARRNAIPFFGVGLIAEINEDAILANVDENDEDGDGISGRPNWDDGFVGRFGRKSQTVSIEGFIRGPLFNHAGITTDPLTNEQRAQLPVDSSSEEVGTRTSELVISRPFAQAAAPGEPLTDDDGIADPEMSTDELFDLVSFAMLLAAPEPEPLNEQTTRGMEIFSEVNCDGCHVPTLEAPRGLIPLYSDLLLHDMGEEMSDGLEQGVALGSEFRTQPLWGVAPVGPYLHDGRADTLAEAILHHGGEAQQSRDDFAALTADDQEAVIAFLESLGGRELVSDGLLAPDAEIPAVGEPGGPTRDLGVEELESFDAGRRLFDRDFARSEGLGTLFNGDSCRACHFDPVIGRSRCD